VERETFILHPNAVPVYGLLSLINARSPEERPLPRRRVLDCGAGGAVPPLALFSRHGFEAWGLDVAEEPLEKAKAFCQEEGVALRLHRGDMRRIPFKDGSFDHVYEQYSMCHLSKADTAVAVGEMKRVLKSGGLCLLGVISTDTWPKSLFGEEKAPGEYWGAEGEELLVLHSTFTDREADALAAGWDVVSKKKRVTYLWEVAQETTLEAWMALLEEGEVSSSQDAWRAGYENRANAFRYVHLYYVLTKP
jgi:ubiquinone/menaquinone biosynthesis C-methylase UbiE